MANLENQAKSNDRVSEGNQPNDIPAARTEAYNSFQYSQNSDATRAATEKQVALGNLPSFSIDTGIGGTADDARGGANGANRFQALSDTGFGKNEPGSDASFQLAAAGSRTETREARTSRGDRHRHDHGEPEGRPPVDARASERFKSEHDRTVQSVRDQMPEGVRDTLKDIKTTPVRSILHGEAGGVYDPDSKELLLAEKRPGNVSLESVVKHEFGHAYDFNQKDGKPLSEDKEFRKMVDDYTKKHPELRMQKRAQGDSYYGEVFADLFAANLNAPGKDLAAPHVDRQMPAAKDWVRRKMMRSN
ncbi:hypothetical protein KF913_05520 [Candidatus Obscuribacterales bacterium]|nr:hypothetical protein [Candidatus Obscuribacterales bacterium]